MRLLLSIIFLVVIIGFAANSTAVQQPQTTVNQSQQNYVKGQIIVKLKSSAGHFAQLASVQSTSSSTLSNSRLDRLDKKFKIKKARRILKKRKLNRVRRFQAQAQTQAEPEGDTFLLEVDELPDKDTVAIAKAYSVDPDVEYAEPNYIYETATDDTYYGTSGAWGQDHLDLWGLDEINAGEAWQLNRGEGAVVAVIDTGVDYNHPDIAENMWQNPGEIPDNGIDDDQNGYIDDTYGYDFTMCANLPFLGLCLNPKPVDSDPMDDNGHGTHVAGTIAAAADNQTGIVGVAYNSRIMAIQGLTTSGDGSASELANAIIYAVDNGADVINASWVGGSKSQVLADAVQYAVDHNVVFVAAAGNDATDVKTFYPASYPHVIKVAALDQSLQLASFSNFGLTIDISAPGVDILSLSAQASENTLAERSPNKIVATDYMHLRGTSMAAPHVSGVAAMAKSLQPNLNSDQFNTLIRYTATPLQESMAGAGIIDMRKAAEMMHISTPPGFYGEITSVRQSKVTRDRVEVQGLVTGEGFGGYEIYMGKKSANNGVVDEWHLVFSHDGQNSTAIGSIGIFDVSHLEEGVYAFKLDVISNNPFYPGVRRSSYFEDLEINRNLKVGWGEAVGGVQNLNVIRMASGNLHLIAIDKFFLYQFNQNGVILRKSDLSTQLQHNVISVNNLAVGDLNEDGLEEIVISGSIFYNAIEGVRGFILILNEYGQTANGFANNPMIFSDDYDPSPVVLADLDMDGKLNMILHTARVDDDERYLWVFDENGNNLNPNIWPKKITEVLGQSLTKLSYDFAVGDVDGKKTGLEIVLGTHETDEQQKVISGTIIALNKNGEMVSGFPAERTVMGDALTYHLALGDVDADDRLEIFVEGATTAYKWLYNNNGSLMSGWPMSSGDTSSRAPASMADLDGDGRDEIIWVYQNKAGDPYIPGVRVEVKNADGSNFSSDWPKTVPIDEGFCTGSTGGGLLYPSVPIIGDVDGDEKPDIVFAVDKYVIGLDLQGNIILDCNDYHMRDRHEYNYDSPLLADIDGDGLTELLAHDFGGRVYAWDLNSTYKKETMPWPMHRANRELTGAVMATGNGGGTSINYGDVNNDGRVNALDAALVAQHVVTFITLDPAAQARAEVSGDGKISALDAALIAQYTVTFISEFPVE